MANLATIVNNILADSGIDDANVAVITGSNQFNGSQTITGSLTVTGQITAQTLNVQQVTSSIVYSSGSNIFGNSLSDTQQLTGSVSVTGSMNVNGTPVSVGTGSAGQVAFWDGTSSQTGDNGLFWDNTNKRLGVGTNAPASPLQVNGVTFISAAAQGNINTENSAPLIVQNTLPYANPFQQFLQIWRNSAGTAIMALRVDGFLNFPVGGSIQVQSYRATTAGNGTSTWAFRFENNGIFFPDGNKIAFSTNGSEKMRITDAGNLLINNFTDAGFRLDVNGTARVATSLNTPAVFSTDEPLSLYGGFTNRGRIDLFNGTTGLAINFLGNGSSRMQLHSNGNLLIGTTTDAGFRLDVSGSARVSGNTVVTGSVQITGTPNTSTSSSLVVYGSGSAQPVFTVQGSQGELFSITDSLSGSLFSVNDISGLPILEVFSNGDTLIGDYTAPAVYTTRRVASTTAGVNVIYSLATSSYDGVFVDYTIRSGSVGRAGNFMAMWSGSSTDFTDTSINGFGTTPNFVFGASISGSNLIVSGSGSTAGWTVKTIIRGI